MSLLGGDIRSHCAGFARERGHAGRHSLSASIGAIGEQDASDSQTEVELHVTLPRHHTGNVESARAIFKDFTRVDHGGCSADAADHCSLIDAIRQLRAARFRTMVGD